MYEKCFSENWTLPALTDYFKNETFTYGELSEEVLKMHILFEALDVQKGDRIALVGRNNPHWCIAFMATITYGAVIVPILQDFNANDVHHIINHSESVLLFAGDQNYDAIDHDVIGGIRASFSLTDFSLQFCNDLYRSRLDRCSIEGEYNHRYPKGLAPEQLKFYQTPNENMVLLNYTSGTTGFSKGVMLSGNNLAGNMIFGRNLGVHYPGSRALSFLPLAHAYGCAFDFLYPLMMGGHVTLLGKIPAPKILLQAMSEVRPTVIFMVPLIIEKIYKKQILPMLEKNVAKFVLRVPLVDNGVYALIRKKMVESFGGAFDHIMVGGASLNRDVEDFLKKIKFPFTVGYGMTECGPLISYESPERFVSGSCGRILDGLMEVRIKDRDTLSGIGQIEVRGENVMMGYYKNDKATADVFDGDWLRTGDMGSTADDGTIFIRGRSKTMILRASGQNIYPEEIESKLNNMPCINECLIVERDGKLVALVYPDYDALDAMGVKDTNIIYDIMAENLVELNKLVASYEQVTSVVLYPAEFEKTPKRSIKRYLYVAQ